MGCLHFCWVSLGAEPSVIPTLHPAVPWQHAWLLLFSSQAEWKQLWILPALFKTEKCWSSSAPLGNPEVAQSQSIPGKLLLCDVLQLPKLHGMGGSLFRVCSLFCLSLEENFPIILCSIDTCSSPKGEKSCVCIAMQHFTVVIGVRQRLPGSAETR